MKFKIKLTFALPTKNDPNATIVETSYVEANSRDEALKSLKIQKDEAYPLVVSIEQEP